MQSSSSNVLMTRSKSEHLHSWKFGIWSRLWPMVNLAMRWLCYESPWRCPGSARTRWRTALSPSGNFCLGIWVSTRCQIWSQIPTQTLRWHELRKCLATLLNSIRLLRRPNFSLRPVLMPRALLKCVHVQPTMRLSLLTRSVSRTWSRWCNSSSDRTTMWLRQRIRWLHRRMKKQRGKDRVKSLSPLLQSDKSWNR